MLDNSKQENFSIHRPQRAFTILDLYHHKLEEEIKGEMEEIWPRTEMTRKPFFPTPHLTFCPLQPIKHFLRSQHDALSAVRIP